MAYPERQLPHLSVIAQENEFGEQEHHLRVGDRDLGLIDFDSTEDEHRGFVDGVDASVGMVIYCKRLRQFAWPAIAEAMRAIHPNLETLENPQGLIFH